MRPDMIRSWKGPRRNMRMFCAATTIGTDSIWPRGFVHFGLERFDYDGLILYRNGFKLLTYERIIRAVNTDRVKLKTVDEIAETIDIFMVIFKNLL